MALTHLTASIRAIRTFRRRFVTADFARDEVKRLALHFALGTVTREDDRLAQALTKATGCTIAELSVFAEDWPG